MSEIFNLKVENTFKKIKIFGIYNVIIQIVKNQ